MSFMVGLMAGSLYVLWPFKAIKFVGEKPVYLGNIIPVSFGKIEVYSIIAALVGVMLIFGFYLFEKKNEKKL